MRMLIPVLVVTSAVYAQTEPPASVATARQLYASADYRAALDVLDHLAATNPATSERLSIDLYRRCASSLSAGCERLTRRSPR